MTGRSISEFVAIAVIAHICIHISVIVTDIYRYRMPVVRREMSPIPGGMPGSITRPDKVRIYGRNSDKYGLNDIIGAIDIGSTYNLDTGIGVDCGYLRNEGGYVLIHIVGEDCLDDKDVSVALNRLYNPQIIDIPVTVEIQIRQHI